MAQSIKGTLDGLFTAMTSALSGQTGVTGDPVLVSYGPPGSYQPGAIVAVGTDTRQQKTRPTMGPGRSRETSAEIDITVSVYVAGGAEVQQLANDKCIDLCDLIEAYSRTNGNESLGGGCRDSFVSAIQGPTPDVAYDPQSSAPMGRIAEAIVTYQVAIRT